MTALGLYLPGSSPLHRAPVAAKLAVLLVVGVSSAFLDSAWQALVALAAVVAGYRLAGLSLRIALRQLRPLVWVLALLAAFHALVNGLERAVVVVGVVAALVLLASLVTLTTRTAELMGVLVALCRPLRFAGVDPDRVGLLLALGVRSVPVVVDLAAQVRDAQRARGLGASPRAFAVPLVVRALRHADALGEALLARGVDD